MNDPLLVVAVGALLGLVMGLLGGGGGVLAVPLLVALGLSIRHASTASLVVVGLGALAGLIPHHRARRVDWRLGLAFGALGSVGAIIGGRLGVTVNPLIVAAGFPVLLVLASLAMFRSARNNYPGQRKTEAPADVTTPDATISWPFVVAMATGVGLITGFFGVGGGFIVVPALVAALRIPITRATATGLVVIAINSAVALVARHGAAPPWGLTLTMAAATAVFTVVGALVSRRVPGWVLSATFGALTLAVAVYTTVRLLTAGIS